MKGIKSWSAPIEEAMPNMATRKVFRDFVVNLAALSKCHDKGVACIICDNNLKQIYSIGVNGGPSGIYNLDCLCDSEYTKYSCIHAEANALVKLTTRAAHKIMICSLSPCLQCASMIINEPCGFDAVLFVEPHKDTKALSLLVSAGIHVGALQSSGHIFWLDHLRLANDFDPPAADNSI